MRVQLRARTRRTAYPPLRGMGAWARLSGPRPGVLSVEMKGEPMQSVEQIAQKWAQRTSAASEDYKAGVRNYSGNPMERAAQQIPYYLQKVNEAVSSGRMAAALRNTPKEKWVSGAVNKGAARISAGVAESRSLYVAHLNKFMPVYQAIKDEVANMPKGTTEDGLNRVRVAIQRLKAAAGKPI